MCTRKIPLHLISIALLVAASTQAKLLIELTLEDGKYPTRDTYPYLHSHGERGGGYSKGSTSKSISIVSDRARSGKYSIRFSCNKSRKRAEMKTTNDPPMCERWFGYSNFIPSDWKSGGWGYYSQWHSRPDLDKGEKWNRGPIIAMILGAGLIWELGHKAMADAINKPEQRPEVSKKVTLKPIDRGEWCDWVVHIIYDWNPGGRGLIEIWSRRKGEKWGPRVYHYKGPVGYNDKVGPYWNWGTYEPGSQGHVRVMYYDEIRQGDENSGFLEIQPGQDGTVPPDLNKSTGLAPNVLQKPRSLLSARLGIPVAGTMRIVIDRALDCVQPCSFQASGRLAGETVKPLMEVRQHLPVATEK